MLQQNYIRLTHKPIDPVLDSKEITCIKHNMIFYSQLLLLPSGKKAWTECPECRADARRKAAAYSGRSFKTDGAYHQASLAVRGGK